MSVRVTISGDKAMKDNLLEIARASKIVARRGTRDYANELLEIAKDRCPVRTGAARDSGRVRVSIRAGKAENISASLVFGSPELRYVPIIHETHKTKSKWVERTIMEAQPKAGVELSAKIGARQILAEAKLKR